MPPTSPLPALLCLLGNAADRRQRGVRPIVAVVPVYIFVLFRFAVASAALALMGRQRAGPRLAQMSLVQRRDLLPMALVGMVGFTG